jgi:hypothetical protein
MKNRPAPRHAKTRASRSADAIPDSTMKGHAGGPSTPRILAVALAVASLGAGAAVLSGHDGSTGHASTPHQAGHASLTVVTSPTGTFHADVPWML